MRDLARQLSELGHEVVVVMPDPALPTFSSEEHYGGVSLVRLKTLQAKDIGHKRRALMELLMPYLMRMLWRQTSHYSTSFDAVVWYSPSIFFGPFVREFKRRYNCPGYLIIRDIFPEWAVDMNLIRPGIAYRILKAIAQQQYREADVVGVQTQGNLPYFDAWAAQTSERRVEVLPNWLGPIEPKPCSIDISSTCLRGRKIFVYAGNMGVAQGMDVMIGLIRVLKHRADVGFLFVGRGTESERLRRLSQNEGLTGVLFRDEIDPDEIPDLYRQCHVGLVALDIKHKSHNIPGKFISYMQAGLPALASVNPGNDLKDLIEKYAVGRCDVNADAACLARLAEDLLAEVESDAPGVQSRCVELFSAHYAAHTVAQQLVDSLKIAQSLTRPATA